MQGNFQGSAMGILTELRPIRTRTRASTAQSLTLEVDTTTKSVSRLQMVAIAGWVAQTADTAHATTNHRTTRGSKIERKTMKEGTLGTFTKASTRIPHQVCIYLLHA